MNSYLSKVPNKPTNKPTNKPPNKPADKPNVARQAAMGNVATSTQENPSSNGGVATLSENVFLPDPQEELSKFTKELKLAEDDARAAHDEHVRLAKNLARLDKELERADANEAEVVKRMIMDVTPKVADALDQAKEMSDRVDSLRERKKNAVKRATEEISKRLPPEKKTTDPAAEYVRKLPKTDPALSGRTIHRAEKKTVPKSKIPGPTAPQTFNAAIGIGKEAALVDELGNVNALARANPLIQKKGLAGHLEQIVELERASHSINAGIHKLKELVNEAATKLVGDGTPIPAVEAAKEQLKVLQTTHGLLKSAIQSAKDQFLAMYKANKVKEFRDFKLNELMNVLKSTDFVNLAEVASAAQHGDAQFFRAVALSCFFGGITGHLIDTLFSSLTPFELERRFVAHGVAAGIGTAGMLEWQRGNLAGVSDSSKALAVGVCTLALFWALGVL
jgi:hypothetical protein